MKLTRFEIDGREHSGVVFGDEVADLGPDDSDDERLVRLLSGGAAVLASCRELARHSPRLPLADVRLRAPIPRPGKFFAIGLNYAAHVTEGGRDEPDFPVFFNKQITCVTGPGDPIHVPRASSMVDYEGELAVVIARRCRHVPATRAPEVVGGYMIVNDVSVRDWQKASPTMTLGKSWDTHGPTGPWIVTKDEIPDPHDLALTTTVSGEVLQSASTAEMIRDVWHQIETLSTVCTLEPGDIVSTGTPAGVGAWREPPRWLVPGDEVTIEIEGIGALSNPVVAEPENTRLL